MSNPHDPDDAPPSKRPRPHTEVEVEGASRLPAIVHRIEQDRRLGELEKIKLDPELLESEHLQANAVQHIWRMRKHLSPDQFDSQVEAWAPLLDRCRYSADPQATLRQVLDIDKQEDVRRALAFRPEQVLEFKYEPDTEEPNYPTTGTIGRYMLYARQSMAPLGFHFWSFVTIMGAACRRNVYSECGSFRVYQNWYTLLGGVSGTAKSAAFSTAMGVLHRVNDLIGEGENVDHLRINVLPEDSTVESITDKLHELSQSRGVSEVNGTKVKLTDVRPDATAVFALDELANFLGKGHWNLEKRIPFLVTIKDKDHHTKMTQKGGEKELRNLAVTFFACCAPAWLRRTITPDMVEGGMNDRTMYIYRTPAWGRRAKYGPLNVPPLDPLARDLIAKELLRYTLVDQDKVVIRYTADAQRYVQALHVDLVTQERAAFERFGDESEATSAPRAGMNILRLAGTLALSEQFESFPTIVVDSSHVDAARGFLDLESNSLRQFLDQAARGPDAGIYTKMLRWLEQRGGCTTQTQFTQRFKSYGDSGKLKGMYLKTLLDGGELEHELRGKSTFYWLPGHERCGNCGRVGLGA